MALETKVILKVLADSVLRSDSVKEAYSIIVGAANVEGLQLPPYEEAIQELEQLKKPKTD